MENKNSITPQTSLKKNKSVLTCKRCGYSWEYKGTKKYWTSCPMCKTSVRINPFLKTKPVGHFDEN